MSFDYILLLAAIQGITEFIPVSSSGHLTLAHGLTGAPDHGVSMDVALHVGTLAAVMVYFRADLVDLLHGGRDILYRRASDQQHRALCLIIATVPVLVAAAVLLASGWLDALRSAKVVAWASIVFAVPLYLADRYGGDDKTLAAMRHRPALVLGLAQILSLIPGASRAGVTIMAGRAVGFHRPAAAKFSMLMAMPVILCFALFGLLELVAARDYEQLGAAAIGAALAAVFAFVTIDLFMRMTRAFSLLPFVVYRIALGVAILVYLS